MHNAAVFNGESHLLVQQARQVEVSIETQIDFERKVLSSAYIFLLLSVLAFVC
jgi:hypothetical protein